MNADGWAKISEENERDGYMPVRVNVIECVSYRDDEEEGKVAARFSRMSVWTASSIDEGKFHDLIGLDYPAAMNSIRHLGRIETRFLAEHSTSHPSGTVMAQDYRADSGILFLTFSAGPEPAANEYPKPIFMGFALEHEQNQDKESAVFRWIAPKSEGRYQITIWYHTPAGSENGRWGHFQMGFLSEEAPSIRENRISSMGYNVFKDYSYNAPLSYVGDGILHFAATTSHRDDDWPNFNEIPDSQKTYTDASIRLIISEESFLTGAEFAGIEIYKANEIYREGQEIVNVTFRVNGDFNNYNINRQLRGITARGRESSNTGQISYIKHGEFVASFDEEKERFDSRHRSVVSSTRKEFLALAEEGVTEISSDLAEKYIKSNLLPASIVVFRNDEETLGEDGIITVNKSYDIIDITY